MPERDDASARDSDLPEGDSPERVDGAAGGPDLPERDASDAPKRDDASSRDSGVPECDASGAPERADASSPETDVPERDASEGPERDSSDVPERDDACALDSDLPERDASTRGSAMPKRDASDLRDAPEAPPERDSSDAPERDDASARNSDVLERDPSDPPERDDASARGSDVPERDALELGPPSTAPTPANGGGAAHSRISITSAASTAAHPRRCGTVRTKSCPSVSRLARSRTPPTAVDTSTSRAPDAVTVTPSFSRRSTSDARETQGLWAATVSEMSEPASTTVSSAATLI